MGRRDGDWFFYGATAMLAAVRWTELTPSALFFGALAIGWAINDCGAWRTW